MAHEYSRKGGTHFSVPQHKQGKHRQQILTAYFKIASRGDFLCPQHKIINEGTDLPITLI